MTLDLDPQIEAALNAAARQRGINPTAFLEQLIAEQLAPVNAVPALVQQEDPTLALFDEWEREDAARTPEQVAADDRLWNEFEQGINANRQEQGMRLL